MYWFKNTANSFCNGAFNFEPARSTLIKRSDGKLTQISIPSLRDRIVQEGLRFLLETIYERMFKKCSHGFSKGHKCRTALNQIKMRFGSTK
jgi:retron-type reverse transcriptase